MAAAVFLMRMPPGSTSGVGKVSSSSGFPGLVEYDGQSLWHRSVLPGGSS